MTDTAFMTFPVHRSATAMCACDLSLRCRRFGADPASDPLP
jgi:hypothetical protein